MTPSQPWLLATVLVAACGDAPPAAVDAPAPRPDAGPPTGDATAPRPDADPPTGDAAPVDLCSPNPCTAPHQTVCAVVDGRATCGCDPGYHDDRGTCVVDAPPDDDDHGDTYATGSPLTADAQLQVGVIETPGDQDWFRIALLADHVYELATAPAGTTLVAAVVAPGGAPELASGAGFRWKATSAGIHGVRVTRPGGFTGAYTVQVVGRGRDDFADDLAGATATADAALGATVAGELQFPRDQDWIPVAVTSGRRYGIALTTTVSLVTYEVYADDGTRLYFGSNPYVTATTDRLFVRVFDTAVFYGGFTIRVTETP